MTDDNDSRPATMMFWDKFEKTDPRMTSKSDYGAKLTSINGIYQVKKMTEMFGPCGLGWGFEITQSQLDITTPLYAKVYDSQARKPVMFLNDQGEPKQICVGQLHTMHIKLWYRAINTTVAAWVLGAEPPEPETRSIKEAITHIPKYEVEGIGHTPYIYMQANDFFPQADVEYEKKSLTDALTNAMAKIGMSADVRMGLFDLPDYVKGLHDGIAVDEAEDSAVEIVKQRHDFEDWYAKHIQLMATTASIRELELLFTGARPRVEREGSKDLAKEHKETKDMRFRELMPKEDKPNQQGDS